MGDGIPGCAVTDMIVVGTKPAGNGRWGQADLAGNVFEWTLDWYATYQTPCSDCADLATASFRVLRAVTSPTATPRVSGRPTATATAQGAATETSGPAAPGLARLADVTPRCQTPCRSARCSHRWLGWQWRYGAAVVFRWTAERHRQAAQASTTCGPSGTESCCTSLLSRWDFLPELRRVDYPDMSYPATVSDFYLDKYEITWVGSGSS